MDNTLQLIDNLNQMVQIIRDESDSLRYEKRKLKQEFEALKAENERLKQILREKEEQLSSRRLAQGIKQGTDTSAVKQQIERLIKHIDHSIALISDTK